MDRPSLQRRLEAAVAPHDLLCHPFYKAWSAGQLTRDDLRWYAAEYRHQVTELPALLRSALAAAKEPAAQDALRRNVEEEEGAAAWSGGRAASHRDLWEGFAAAVDAPPAAEAEPTTRAAVDGLRAVVGEGELEALAGLWAYEVQTARVSETKRTGLRELYGVAAPAALEFFAVHAEIDQFHAADLAAAVARRCRTEADVERACAAAARVAQAQWLFLDGAEARRASVAA
jgi:pyrroloquinoline-quinone synthase